MCIYLTLEKGPNLFLNKLLDLEIELHVTISKWSICRWRPVWKIVYGNIFKGLHVQCYRNFVKIKFAHAFY